MYVFQVPKIRCGGCASSIRQAIEQIDEHALIEIDIAAKTVSVASAKAEEEIVKAMSNAGYPPV
jgi:copper chaperone